jgi:hypothetical protein
MKIRVVLAVAFTASMAAAQTNVVVTAESPALKSNAALLQKITADAMRKYADGNPLKVSIVIGRGESLGIIGDASMHEGYRAVDTSGVQPYGRALPLVGGMYPDVGFQPTVNTGEGTVGYAPGSIVFVRGAGSLVARYVIADAAGKVIETRTVPLAASRVVAGGALESYRDTGAYIAKRLAKLQ